MQWSNAGLMLGQRHRRWANIKPAFGPVVVFAGSNYTLWAHDIVATSQSLCLGK